MAIFVEGRTELEFDSKLIHEIASGRSVTIESRKIRGGTTTALRRSRIELIKVGDAQNQSTHFFLLFDCGNDQLVKSRMIDEYRSLEKAGYQKIICHRDVAPTVPHADLARLEAGLPYGVRTKPINVTFVLSVMEVEAWFLAEHGHFARIDPAITREAISSGLGFDPHLDDMQTRPTPARDLGDCYALAGKHYDKFTSQATIDAIDYVSVFCDIAKKFPHLGRLCDEIGGFLDLAAA